MLDLLGYTACQVVHDFLHPPYHDFNSKSLATPKPLNTLRLQRLNSKNLNPNKPHVIVSVSRWRFPTRSSVASGAFACASNPARVAPCALVQLLPGGATCVLVDTLFSMIQSPNLAELVIFRAIVPVSFVLAEASLKPMPPSLFTETPGLYWCWSPTKPHSFEL